MKKIIYMLTLFAIANNTFCSDKKHASAVNLSINKKELHKNPFHSDNSLMIEKDTINFNTNEPKKAVVKNEIVFKGVKIDLNNFNAKSSMEGELIQKEIDKKLIKQKNDHIEQRKKDFKEQHPQHCGDPLFIKYATGESLEMIKHCPDCLKILLQITQNIK